MSAPEPLPDPGIDTDTFLSVFRSYAAGVSVITTDPGTGPVGLTATSVISASLDPPLVVFSIGRESSRYAAFDRARTVAVNFLSAEQAELAEHFAARGIDWFSAVAWSRLPDRTPTLDESPSVIHGPIEDRHTVGDHDLLVVRLVSADQRRAYRPLVHHDRSYRGTLDRTD
ncbi:MAG: flavin reductase family protein [Propionibacteriaceae bacterium]